MFHLFCFCSNVSIREEFIRQWMNIFMAFAHKWSCCFLKGLSIDNGSSKECTDDFYQNLSIFDGDHFRTGRATLMCMF